MNHQQDILYKLLTEKEKKNRKTKKKKTKKRKRERRDVPYIIYIKNKYLHSLKKGKANKRKYKNKFKHLK